MAAATVETKKLIWNKGEEYAATAVDTTDGAYLTPGNDEATLIVLTSSVAVESGRFKITKGANAGKIKVTTSAAGLSAGCIVLPR